MALVYKEEVNDLMNLIKDCSKKGYTEFLVKQRLDKWLSKVIDKYVNDVVDPEDDNV